MKYFQCLVIGKNWASLSRASCLVISNRIEQYEEKKFGDGVCKSC
jgi:hypothetical protein